MAKGKKSGRNTLSRRAEPADQAKQKKPAPAPGNDAGESQEEKQRQANEQLKGGDDGAQSQEEKQRQANEELGRAGMAPAQDGAGTAQPAGSGVAAVEPVSQASQPSELGQGNDVQGGKTGEALNDGQEGRVPANDQQDPAASQGGVSGAAGGAGVQAGDAQGGAHGRAANHDEDDGESPEVRRVRAAYKAASDAYEAIADDHRFAGPSPVRPIMLEAGAFVRQWPDAPSIALAGHVRMKGFRDVPEPGPREEAAWKVFAFTLRTLDQVDRELAEQKPAEPAPAWTGEQALKPEPPALAPVGFSPR